MGLRDGHMAGYAATHAGSKEAMLRASRTVSAHRRHGQKRRDDFFSPELEGLGAIDPMTWKSMSPEEKKHRLEEGQGKSA